MTAPLPPPPPLSEGLDSPLVWDFKMWPLAVLTGERINGIFFIYMDVLLGRKNLAVIRMSPYRRGDRKAGFHCTTNLSKRIHTKF